MDGVKKIISTINCMPVEKLDFTISLYEYWTHNCIKRITMVWYSYLLHYGVRYVFFF